MLTGTYQSQVPIFQQSLGDRDPIFLSFFIGKFYSAELVYAVHQCKSVDIYPPPSEPPSPSPHSTPLGHHTVPGCTLNTVSASLFIYFFGPIFLMIKFQRTTKNDIPRLHKMYLKGIEKYLPLHVF